MRGSKDQSVRSKQQKNGTFPTVQEIWRGRQNFKTIKHIKDISTLLCNVLATEANLFDIRCLSEVIAINWLIVQNHF